LAQDTTERLGERCGVLAHLALADHRALVVVEELDGSSTVMMWRGFVSLMMSTSEEAMSTSRTGRTGHEHEASA